MRPCAQTTVPPRIEWRPDSIFSYVRPRFPNPSAFEMDFPSACMSFLLYPPPLKNEKVFADWLDAQREGSGFFPLRLSACSFEGIATLAWSLISWLASVRVVFLWECLVSPSHVGYAGFFHTLQEAPPIFSQPAASPILLRLWSRGNTDARFSSACLGVSLLNLDTGASPISLSL